MRARAGDEPVSTWLRRLALDAPAPTRSPRQRRERPLHPQAVELVRVAALSGNHLRRLREVLIERGISSTDIHAALQQIDGRLARALELT